MSSLITDINSKPTHSLQVLVFQCKDVGADDIIDLSACELSRVSMLLLDNHCCTVICLLSVKPGRMRCMFAPAVVHPQKFVFQY